MTRTTWKARGLIAAVILAFAAGPLRVALPAVAAPLIREDDALQADLIVIQVSENPSFASIQHAARLYRSGAAPRIALTQYRDSSRLRSAGIVLPPAFDRILTVYVEEAGLDSAKLERIPISVDDPVSLNTARQVAEYCDRTGIRHVIIVGPPFHSRRTALSYRRFFEPRHIQLYMSPAWSGLTTSNWWKTKDGVLTVGYEWVGLLGYLSVY